jgi:hypothetical protein
MIFFIAVLVGTQKTIRIARKLNSPGAHKDWKTGQAIATCLQLSFIGMLICGFFLANANYIFWYLFGGIALALERVTLHLIAEERRRQPVPTGRASRYRDPVTGIMTGETNPSGRAARNPMGSFSTRPLHGSA